MKSDQVRLIESSGNKYFKTWKSCTEPKGAKKNGIAILSGRKLVDEFLKQQPFRVLAVIGDTDIEKTDDLFDYPVFGLTKPLLKQLDTLGTGGPLLAIEVPELIEWTQESPQGCELFLALQDPGNLGAALRLAESFGAQKVICLEECAHPFHPKCIKASAGSALRVAIEKGPSIHSLTDTNLDFIGLDKSGQLIQDFNWPSDFRLILGEEGPGLPDSLKPTALQIPIHENVESLNATSALSIALYAYQTSTKS